MKAQIKKLSLLLGFASTLIVALAPAHSAPIADIGGQWIGKYSCGPATIGASYLVTQDGDDISVIYDMYVEPENPFFSGGSVISEGEYDANTREMKLRSARWLRNPGGGWNLADFVVVRFDADLTTLSSLKTNSICPAPAFIRAAGDQPCKEVAEFRLSQHPYLRSLDSKLRPKPLDPRSRPTPHESKLVFGEDYHHYTVETPICREQDTGCTRKSVFQKMLSQRKFVAPAEKDEHLPVSNCSVSDLQGPGIAGQLASLFYSDFIVSIVDPTNFTVVNYTLDPPGLINSHIFHPGRVLRSVVQKNGDILVRTEGEGTGILPETNESDGAELFRAIDLKLREHVTSGL